MQSDSKFTRNSSITWFAFFVFWFRGRGLRYGLGRGRGLGLSIEDLGRRIKSEGEGYHGLGFKE